METYNLFVHDFKKRNESRGKVKGYRKPPKSKTTMRVGGRKISAAPKDNKRYKFPVVVSYKA